MSKRGKLLPRLWGNTTHRGLRRGTPLRQPRKNPSKRSRTATHSQACTRSTSWPACEPWHVGQGGGEADGVRGLQVHLQRGREASPWRHDGRRHRGLYQATLDSEKEGGHPWRASLPNIRHSPPLRGSLHGGWLTLRTLNLTRHSQKALEVPPSQLVLGTRAGGGESGADLDDDAQVCSCYVRRSFLTPV